MKNILICLFSFFIASASHATETTKQQKLQIYVLTVRENLIEQSINSAHNLCVSELKLSSTIMKTASAGLNINNKTSHEQRMAYDFAKKTKDNDKRSQYLIEQYTKCIKQTISENTMRIFK